MVTSDCQILHYSKVQNPTDFQIIPINQPESVAEEQKTSLCILAEILYYETKSLIKHFINSNSRHKKYKKLQKGANGVNLPHPPNVFLLNTKHLKPYEVTNQ